MARLLSRLGSLSAGRPWVVIIGWLLTLVLAGGAAAFSGVQLAAGFSIPDTPTQRVADRLAEEFEGVGGAVGTVVFQTDDGSEFSDEQRAAITEALDEVSDMSNVSRVIDPFVTADERATREQQLDEGGPQLEAARAQLEASEGMMDPAAYAEALTALEEQQEQLDLAGRLAESASSLRTISESGTTAVGAVLFDAAVFDLNPVIRNDVSVALSAADIPGVQLYFSVELVNAIGGLLGVGELIGLLIAGIVLVVIFRAIRPAVIPIVSSIIGVGIGVAASLAFSGVVDMASITPLLGVMLGLAVGIDYSLFIINRHRQQLISGMEVRESIALANGTAGNAVVFAGSTVFIALLALNVMGIPFVGVMGTVGAACVLIAVLIAVTLTPALLGLLGVRALSRRARANIGQQKAVAAPRAMPTWRAVVTAVVAVGVLLVIAIPAASLRLGFAGGSVEPEESTQYQAYSTVAEEFGAGRNGGLVVSAEPDLAVDSENQLAVLRMQVEIVELLMAQDGVAAVTPLEVAESGELLAFQVVPEEGPSSESTEQLVEAVRSLSPIESSTNGEIELGVAGQASANIDISAAVAQALPLYLAVVIGLSILIMLVVFRSILVPVIATGGFLLSFLAALGAVTAVFQWGWLGELFGVHEPGPVLNFAPVMLVGVLFGLAMDYQLFIASGMREAFVHGAPARIAVVAGARSARTVVTAAALIMVAVFGGFVFSELAMIRPIGFGLAIGVLFDAFLVRLLLMPALMHILGRSAWWIPGWLDRLLPDVDIEGASLENRKELA